VTVRARVPHICLKLADVGKREASAFLCPELCALFQSPGRCGKREASAVAFPER
jgi:hypothetical protein